MILGLLVALFAAAGFDTGWMRENAGFIARGITWTIVIAVLSILLASVLALLGALGRLSQQRDRGRRDRASTRRSSAVRR